MPDTHHDRHQAADGGSRFSGQLRERTAVLRTLDPEEPLDDLEPLRALIGDARVVALGENSHFVEEFGLARERMLRFLVQRCGFTVLAFEFGFSEGFALDAWVQGQGAEEDFARQTAAAVPIGLSGPLHWLRRHNRTATPPVRFAGVDVPAAGGSLLPALAPVAEYLREVDPDGLPLVQDAMKTAERFGAASMALAAPAWSRLGTDEQDALSAALVRLRIRLRAMEPLYVERGGRREYDIALRRAEAACHTDHQFRAMAALYAGGGSPADTSSREVFMADSVRWLLDRAAPGTRVVLPAHNAHIQRTSVSFDGRLTGLPMGLHLSHALGEDYFALGMTSVHGRTAEMHLDENTAFGFRVEDTALGTPEPGSVEAAFEEAGLGAGIGLAGLRDLRGTDGSGGPDRIRMQSGYLHTPVAEAFDGILSVPSSTVVDDLGF
ncbi:erythromycin esterase family protein [Streptomyces paromomycinus]|uniref:Erythromycin esterase n=1 Tax=Streptomyces paromomycinus TaxID=92743 RepID=A0A401WEZ3_STREY|nr:erythromycin esterase family protein [Streptomyces paromomycinus]GCD47914.1 erythromycin esterase [Streptomyces paromomycinus]